MKKSMFDLLPEIQTLIGLYYRDLPSMALLSIDYRCFFFQPPNFLAKSARKQEVFKSLECPKVFKESAEVKKGHYFNLSD